MLKIGLTGGIGSGKTTVAAIFEVLEIPVYYADEAARKLMNEHAGLKSSIEQHFGKESYTNGILNREYLAATVFNDPEKISTLNKLVHPLTIADAAEWMSKQTSPYVIKEAALIFESQSHLHLDYVIGVYAPTEVRIKRVMQRDLLTAEQVEARMKRQMDETEKMKRSDFVITNDETRLLIPQVIELHEKFLQEAKKRIEKQG